MQNERCGICGKIPVAKGQLKDATSKVYCSCEDLTKLSEARICIETEEFIYWEMDDRQTDLSDDVEE